MIFTRAMRIDEIPAAWGRVKIAALVAPTEETPEWELDGWHSLVFPNAEGEFHHGSRGATMPDAVVISLDENVLANADLDQLVLDNQYAYDAEYYLCLRLREVVDADRWRETPWNGFAPGHLLHAWDKFHHLSYFRLPESSDSMSYGGDWSDLEAVFNREYPPAFAVEPIGPPSAIELLRAIENDNLSKVQALLARGADPNAGLDHAPIYQVEAGLSVERPRFSLWESVMLASPSITKALLAAGAQVDWTPGGDAMTALHGAITNRHFDHVPVLLEGGADPLRKFRGQSAIEMAEREDAESARLLRDWMNRDDE